MGEGGIVSRSPSAVRGGMRCLACGWCGLGLGLELGLELGLRLRLGLWRVTGVTCPPMEPDCLDGLLLAVRDQLDNDWIVIVVLLAFRLTSDRRRCGGVVKHNLLRPD